MKKKIPNVSWRSRLPSSLVASLRPSEGAVYVKPQGSGKRRKLYFVPSSSFFRERGTDGAGRTPFLSVVRVRPAVRVYDGSLTLPRFPRRQTTQKEGTLDGLRL